MTMGGGYRYNSARTKKVVVHLVYILKQLSRYRLTYMYYCSGEKVGKTARLEKGIELLATRV